MSSRVGEHCPSFGAIFTYKEYPFQSSSISDRKCPSNTGSCIAFSTLKKMNNKKTTSTKKPTKQTNKLLSSLKYPLKLF